MMQGCVENGHFEGKTGLFLKKDADVRTDHRLGRIEYSVSLTAHSAAPADSRDGRAGYRAVTADSERWNRRVQGFERRAQGCTHQVQPCYRPASRCTRRVQRCHQRSHVAELPPKSLYPTRKSRYSRIASLYSPSARPCSPRKRQSAAMPAHPAPRDRSSPAASAASRGAGCTG